MRLKPDGMVKEKIVITKDVTSPISNPNGYFNVHWVQPLAYETQVDNNAFFTSNNNQYWDMARNY